MSFERDTYQDMFKMRRPLRYSFPRCLSVTSCLILGGTLKYCGLELYIMSFEMHKCVLVYRKFICVLISALSTTE